MNSTANVLSLYIAASPNGGDIGIRVVEEVSGAAVEFTIATDMPAATQLLSPRNYMNTDATAAAVAYDCSGVYVETDIRAMRDLMFEHHPRSTSAHFR